MTNASLFKKASQALQSDSLCHATFGEQNKFGHEMQADDAEVVVAPTTDRSNTQHDEFYNT